MTTEPLKVNPTVDAGLLNRLTNHLSSALLRLSEAAWTWRARAVSRCDLAELNDQDLKDIGLSRGDAYRESSKPFWRE